ncbi:MAG: aspartate aminotransferase family protein [Lachnospiraceae bacterium]|nr:aspartate aminotransferase family protein [Lachnospiraceae bacterium]
METSKIIDMAEESLIHTYNRYQIVFDHGDGVHLYDNDGKSYLDFCAGIAVFALGYNNKYFNDAIKAQVDKIIHTSNYFYSLPMANAARRITAAAHMDNIFFTNSGTEAIEGALKVAKKFGFLRDNTHDHEVIAMSSSFHGRSMGALSVTANHKYQDPFGPLIPGIRFATYNDLDSVKALISDKTCAIIMETIQGEGGITPATPEFIEGVRKLCDDNNLLMILDEIQCGMGRTGKMFAYDQYGVLPDVVTVAKAIGCGVPLGGFMVRGKACGVLVAGDHGSTYGGNPLATAACNAVLDQYEELDLLNHVEKVGLYMYDKLEELKNSKSCIKDHRGKGLIQGIELSEDVPAGDVVKKAMDKGLILITAAKNVIRFLPPLVVTEADVDSMIDIIKDCL